MQIVYETNPARYTENANDMSNINICWTCTSVTAGYC